MSIKIPWFKFGYVTYNTFKIVLNKSCADLAYKKAANRISDVYLSLFDMPNAGHL